MRRIISLAVAASVALSVLGLAQGGSPSLASSAAVDLSISPPAGQTAITDGQRITFSGTVTPGATIEEALLEIRDADGERARDDLAITSEFDKAALAEGRLAGTTTLSSLPPVNDGWVAVTITVDHEGARASDTSNKITIDQLRPQLASWSLTATDRIKVTFTEPVFDPKDLPVENLVLDWSLCAVPGCDTRPAPDGDGRPPTDIQGSGDHRTLIVDPVRSNIDLGEDSTPTAQYRQTLPHKVYVDRAGMPMGSLNRVRIVADRIAPAAPAIVSIAGKTGDDIVGNDATPTVVLSGINEGHAGQVYAESNEQPGFQPGGDALLGEAPAAADQTATIVVADENALTDDNYILYGAARDQALCDPNDADSEQCPNVSPNADTGHYALDTVAPIPQLAEITETGNAKEIKVEFTEAIHPENGAGQWTLTPGVVTGVTGTGNVRFLTSQAALSPLTEVSWSPSDTAYTDAAGNTVAPFTIEAQGGLPPVVNVTSPTVRTFTRALKVTLRGTSNGGTEKGGWTSEVQIFSQEGGEAIATAIPAADGTWFKDIDLTPNQSNVFWVRGARTDTVPARFGVLMAVPEQIQDSTAPVVSVGPVGRPLPSGGQGLQGSEETVLTWTASDAAPGELAAGPIKIEYSYDGGATWATHRDATANDGEEPWASAEGINTEKARIRITAVDRAGNKNTPAVSNDFIIDSTLPTFSAATVDPASPAGSHCNPATTATEPNRTCHVLVTFSEPVQLDDAPDPAEWTIDDVPVSAAASGQPAGAMVTSLDLTTGLVNGIPQSLDPNAQPTVAYTSQSGTGLVEELKDRVGNTLGNTTAKARDAIAPLPPTPGEVRALVRERIEPVPGTAPQADPTNKVLVRRIFPSATFADHVDPEGGFTVQVWLTANHLNAFKVRVQDPSANLSAESDPVSIEQDQRRPKVKVRKPKKVRKGNRRFLRIRWRIEERNKSHVDIQFRLRGGNTSRRLRTLVRGTPDDGTYRWRIPKSFKGKRFQVTIVGVDKVGNRGTRTYRWLRLP